MLALSFWTIAIYIALAVFTIYVMVRICHIANDTSEITSLLRSIDKKLSKQCGETDEDWETQNGLYPNKFQKEMPYDEATEEKRLQDLIEKKTKVEG